MTIDELLMNSPKIHVNNSVTFGLIKEVLKYIDDNTNSLSLTIETGAGISTILFSMKSCMHICITPDANEVEAVKLFCSSSGLSTDRIKFLIGKSEDILPTLQGYRFDLALIDGGHGFPTPFIDYFYIARNLKKGGLLIIDDIRLWTVDVLKKFLLNDSCWKYETEIYNKTIIFRKKCEVIDSCEWVDQPFVVEESNKITKNIERRERISRFNYHLRKFEFFLIFKKFVRHIYRHIVN